MIIAYYGKNGKNDAAYHETWPRLVSSQAKRERRHGFKLQNYFNFSFLPKSRYKLSGASTRWASCVPSPVIHCLR